MRWDIEFSASLDLQQQATRMGRREGVLGLFYAVVTPRRNDSILFCVNDCVAVTPNCRMVIIRFA